MLGRLNERLSQGRETFSAMTTPKKVALFAGIAAVAAAFVVVLLWANKTEWETLYTGLSQEDAGAIVDKLKESRTPYRLTEGGGAIEVPRGEVQETRLFLATEGLPAGGAVGMELFNETNLGSTDFVQRLNYQRALQGELERTIKKFKEVDQVRVHINMPKEALFIEEEKDPTASVMLRLLPGRQLTQNQLAGVVHLVASSVPGLTTENISVVDASGGLLYNQKLNDGSSLTANQLQHRRATESMLAGRVTAMLEKVVGPDNVMARVTADLNYQQVSADEEIYDPDRTAIRSEQRLKETSQGPGRGAEGVPNQRYQLGNENRQGDETEPGAEYYERTEDTTNYEITRINRRVLTPAGDVERLSVAVILAEPYQEKEQGGDLVKTPTPRTEEEKAKIMDLVKSAVGFKEDRGDSVVVTEMPFYFPEEPEKTWYDVGFDYMDRFGKPAFNVLLIVLFFLFVVRPFAAWVKEEVSPAPEIPEQAALPEGEGEEGALPGPKVEPGLLSRDQVLVLAQQNPDRTINLIRSWIDAH